MSDQNEEVHKDDDTFGLGCALEHFSEYKEVLQMINSLGTLINAKQSLTERAYERYVDVLKQYHEQPHLLDSHLQEILDRIISIVRDRDSGMEVKHACFKYMYFLINVRGYKVIVRHLPHEVADFEPVLKLLESQDPNCPETWTTRYVLLLWLSIIVMIPFHMSRLDGFDSSNSDDKTVMYRVLEMCKRYTIVSDKCRDAAAYLVSKYLTRVDVKEKYMTTFLDWACEMSISTESDVFVKYGTLASIAMIIKHAKRDDILPHARKLLQWIINTDFKNFPGSNIQKLVFKIVQRIGLTFLPPRLAAWRYTRGNRSLTANLSSGDVGQPIMKSVGAEIASDPTDDVDVPEEMEEVIDQLIQGLRNADYVVRWSAAKGIGRVTNRLPKYLADEVVGSVLELFSPRESDAAWHGACLAMAELGRRGLLLPQRLPEVVPVIMTALVYDEPRGYASVGSHIRDAACYVCWSFARAYETDDLKPFVNDIASQLLIVSCFDREINCRRAASAAFQENVGRQGTFPHGIDILTTADFFAVSVRNNAYLTISVYIAQFPEYTHHLIDHLIARKVVHWDLSIRELAAKALHNITPLASEYMKNQVLPILFDKTKSIDLNCRHGSVLALGEILYALSGVFNAEDKAIGEVLDAAAIQEVENLIPTFRERQYFRGLGGELMKQACASFIKKCSLARMQFNKSEVTEDWLSLLNECLSYDVSNIRACAIDALPDFFTQYYSSDTESVETRRSTIVKKYVHELKSESHEVVRMGYSLALGSLSVFMLKSHLDLIIGALIESLKVTPATLKFAESRRDAIKALTSIATTLESHVGTVLTDDHLKQIYASFLNGLEEYTQDNRGDIGAWVREASMIGLQTLTLLLAKRNSELLTRELVTKISVGIAQQAVEKIDRTRALASKIFCSLLYNDNKVPHIPNYEELLLIFPKEECDTLNWNSAAVTFPKFVNLIEFPEYTYNVLLGFVCSVGGMTETLVKSSSQSLFDHLKSVQGAGKRAELERVCATIHELFAKFQRVDRISVPMLRFLNKLFSSGCIGEILYDDSSDFARKCLKLIQQEINGCRDIYKLIDSIDVLCQFIQIKSDVSSTALVQLSILLCHRQPYIRRSTSSKLFESLLVYGDSSTIPAENLDEISEILGSTNWEDNVDEIRPIRNNLCTLMGIRVPVMLKKK